MDDLQLNHIAAEPRSSGRGKRFFVIAVAIAAGLHLLVFGALALSAHNHQTPTAQPAAPPLRPAPAPPPTAAATSSTAPALPAPAPVAAPAAPPARPERHVRPLAHVPRGHAHPAPASSRAPVRKKPAKPVRHKPVKTPMKSKDKHAPATLDLNALSHFNSGK